MKWIRKKKPHPVKCLRCDGSGVVVLTWWRKFDKKDYHLYAHLRHGWMNTAKGKIGIWGCGECNGTKKVIPYATKKPTA